MPEFLQLMERWDGYNPVARVNLSEAAVARFIDLMANKERLPAWRQEYLLREAVTSSDFPALFGFTLERDLLARYRAVVPDWRSYTKVGTLPNFNSAEVHKVIGNDGLLPQVPEKTPYPLNLVAAGHYHRQLLKYGGQFDVSWEVIVNDVLGAFSDIPQRFADAATYTEAFNVTSLYASAAGPDNLLFGAPIADAADGANVTNLGVLPLSIGNLGDTIALMAQQRDAQGKVLGIRAVHLVVPPTLEMLARSILTSALQIGTTTANVPLPATNIMPQMGLQLHVDPLLMVVDTSATNDTTWYLFAEPSRLAALQVDYLRGYEAPEIVMKASDKVTAGGGVLSPFSGDFDTDDIKYRVRLVMGGSRLDPRGAYAQVGP